MARYTYGDSELAGDRLRLVAELFQPTSRAFLVTAGGSPRIAVDLGSGPGETVKLVLDASRAETTFGVERSEAFAARATHAGATTIVGDVAAAWLPTRAADLIYARLLLAHLADPVLAVARWAAVSTVGGRVLVDDLETIETADRVFRRYLDDVALEVVRAQGGALFVGPVLHAAADPDGLRRVHDDVVVFAPPPASTARVFSMNLEVLTRRGEVAPHAELASALHSIAAGDRSAEPVRWHIRQIAWQRTS